MLRPLTSLRFFAALLVFVWHAGLTRGFAERLSLGYLGVGFFFVLSGFILTYHYGHEPVKRDFFIARIARIYPVHIAAVILALLVLPVTGGEHWSALAPMERAFGLLLQLPLLQSWFPSPALHFGINGPSWSLSDEQFFYALFPFATFALGRVLRPRSQTTVLCFAFLCSLVPIFVLSFVHVPFSQWAVHVFPPSRFPDFLTGMLLGTAFLKRPAAQAPRIDATILEICALFGATLGIVATLLSPPAMHFYAVMMPFWAAAVYVFAIGGGAISQALRAPVFVRLGEASYAFYLVHFNVIHLVETVFGSGRPIVNFVVSFGMTLALALALFTYVETPLRRAIREGFSRGTRSGHPAAAPATPLVSRAI